MRSHEQFKILTLLPHMLTDEQLGIYCSPVARRKKILSVFKLFIANYSSPVYYTSGGCNVATLGQMDFQDGIKDGCHDTRSFTYFNILTVYRRKMSFPMLFDISISLTI